MKKKESDLGRLVFVLVLLIGLLLSFGLSIKESAIAHRQNLETCREVCLRDFNESGQLIGNDCFCKLNTLIEKNMQ